MNNFECKICKRVFKNHHAVSNHIRFAHGLKIKDYFDQYLKTKENSTCRFCGKDTIWMKGLGRYKQHCNQKCSGNNPHMMEQRKKTCIERYGTDNINNTEWKINKTKQVCLEKYGQESSVHNLNIHKKAEDTWFKKYGTRTPWKDGIIGRKIKQAIQKKYGVNSSWKIPGVQEKKKQTMLERYGVEHSMQNYDIFQKGQRNCYRAKQYILPSGKEIYIRGFEPQFLNMVFEEQLFKEEDIVFHPKGIVYTNKSNTQTYYYPDFYIPKLNLIVEIKSDYTERLDKNVELKKQAATERGFQYIRIVNNKFEEFVAFVNK